MKNIGRLPLFARILLALVAALSSAAFASAGNNPLSVGVFVCLTGVCADFGANSVKGVTLAAEEINASGGILGRKVTLRVEDTKEEQNASHTIAAFHRLSQDHSIKYFIGPSWGIGAMPLIPLVEKRPDLIVTSPSAGVAQFNEAAPNIFNTWPHDDIASRALARFAIENGWKQAALIVAQNDWDVVQSRVFEEEFQARGGSVVVRIDVQAETKDFSAESLRVKTGGADCVYLPNWSVLPIFARALKKQGYKGRILTVMMNQSILDQSQGATEGTIFTRYKGATTRFSEAFQKRFATAPGITADTAYDALWAYANAVKAAGSIDAVKVTDEMLRVSFDGAAGRVEFDSKGGIRKTPEIWKVEGGKESPY